MTDGRTGIHLQNKQVVDFFLFLSSFTGIYNLIYVILIIIPHGDTLSNGAGVGAGNGGGGGNAQSARAANQIKHTSEVLLLLLS